MNPPPRTEHHPREIPHSPAHYRNWIPRDASEYLRDVVDKMKTLTIIPSGVWPFYEFFNDETEPRTRGEMKEIIESYGWPDQFRREEWKARMKEHWRRFGTENQNHSCAQQLSRNIKPVSVDNEVATAYRARVTDEIARKVWQGLLTMRACRPLTVYLPSIIHDIALGI